MPATHALIELLGDVALLLWGVHMVRTGILRAFGGDLRQLLGRALRNRLAACLAGLGVTVALQSSTATGMMATSFLADGVIGLMPALAVMLGRMRVPPWSSGRFPSTSPSYFRPLSSWGW